MSQKERYPRLDVRCSAIQLERWKALAEQKGMPLPQLVRLVLDEAVRKEGTTQGQEHMRF